MTDEQGQSDSSPSVTVDAIRADAPVSKSPGAMLAERRVARSLTIADVAQRLKYGPRQLEALEQDDYASLPGTTFVRGMIRGYAKLLELDAAPILLELDRRHIPAQVSVDLRSTSIPFPVGGRRSTRVYGVMSIVAVVAALIVVFEWQFGGFSWLWQQAADESAPAKLSATEIQKDPVVQAVAEPVQSEPPADNTTVPLVIAPKVSDSTSTTPVPLTFVPPTPQATPTKLSAPTTGAAPQAANSVRTGSGSTTLPAGVPVAVPGAPVSPGATRPPASASVLPVPTPIGEQRPAAPRARTLALQFERDSWVEIKQANGKVLMSQLNRGGTEQTVEGIPPFEIIIGNAPGVRLTYNNSPIDLRPHLKVDVARLTLE